VADVSEVDVSAVVVSWEVVGVETAAEADAVSAVVAAAVADALFPVPTSEFCRFINAHGRLLALTVWKTMTRARSRKVSFVYRVMTSGGSQGYRSSRFPKSAPDNA